MLKRLAACIREYKAASIKAPLFVSLEVVMEVIIPFCMGMRTASTPLRSALLKPELKELRSIRNRQMPIRISSPL